MFSTIKYMTDLPSTNIKKLWESNAKPHLYWFTAKFIKKKGDSKPRFHRPSLCSGPWRREMDLFMDFFRIKTRIEWQDRVLKQHTMPNSIFQYSPPVSRLIARLVVPQAAFHQFQYLANTKKSYVIDRRETRWTPSSILLRILSRGQRPTARAALATSRRGSRSQR